jgi:hypothetical protein
MFEGDVDAEAAFQGKIQAVGKAFASLAAKGAKIEAVLKAGQGLGASGAAAVEGALDTAGEADLSLGAAADLACGVRAFGSVAGLMTSATGSLAASGEAVAKVTASLGG